MSTAESEVLLPRSSTWHDLSAHTAFWFGVLATGYFFVWTLLPLVMNSEIPGDNLEQLRWALTPDWGYSKHPPFPTLVLLAFEQIAPAGIPLTYFLGALQVAMMLLAATLVARATLPRPQTWIAPLLIMPISYYTFRMHFYNHNTALMVACAGALYCCWQVRTSWQARWWIGLGLCWGLGMLSKYQMAVPIGCNLAFLWTLRAGRLKPIIGGVVLAGLVAAAVLLPHIVWLVHHRFPSFQYAATILGADLGAFSRVKDVYNFLTHQLLRFVPMLLLLALFNHEIRKSTDRVLYASLPPTVNAEARRFFAIHAWGPLIVMAGLSAAFGVDLQSHWGTAFLWIMPLYVLSTPFGARCTSLPPAVVLRSAALIQAVAVLCFISGKFGGGPG